jgi:hypothetical protein
MCSAPSFLPPQVDPHDVEGAGRCNALLTNAGVACIHTRRTYMVCMYTHASHACIHQVACAHAYIQLRSPIGNFSRTPYWKQCPSRVSQAFSALCRPGCRQFKGPGVDPMNVTKQLCSEQAFGAQHVCSGIVLGIPCLHLLNPTQRFTSLSSDTTLPPGPAHPTPFTPLQVPGGDSPENAAARPSFSFEHQAPLAAFSFPSGVTPFHHTAVCCLGLPVQDRLYCNALYHAVLCLCCDTSSFPSRLVLCHA